MGSGVPHVADERLENSRLYRDPLAALAGSRDWAATPLGPLAGWPGALRHAAVLGLGMPEPALIWWGHDLLQVYNAAAAPLFGRAHPVALGWIARHAPPAGWDLLQPLVLRAFNGNGAGFEDQPFALDGADGPDERFFSASLAPLRTEEGAVGGVLGLLRDTTAQVESERRLRLLADLGTGLAGLSSADAACQQAASVFAAYPRDVPIALIYLLSPDGRRIRLAGRMGREQAAPAAPSEVALAADAADAAGWRFARVLASGMSEYAEEARVSPGAHAHIAPPDGPLAMLLVPLIPPGTGQPMGLLVAGVPRRWVGDEGHRSFLERVAGLLAEAVRSGERVQAERRQATVRATLDEAKTAFFTDLGREFLVPLSLILGPLQSLRTAGTETERDQIAIAQRACLRMLKLANTFQQFAQIEANAVVAHREETDLAQFTADLASMFRAVTEAAGLRLIVDCPALPWPVRVDRAMWEKIVLNLLSNAVKFTHRGEIAVTLRLAGDGADERVSLAIRDTGVGIAPRDLPRLFERYQRVRGAGGRTNQGMGIGLSVVRELTRLHDGTVAVESVPGGGTTFTVTLPVPVGAPPDAGTSASARAIPRASAPFVGEVQRWLTRETRPAEDGRAPEPESGETAERLLVVSEQADLRAYLRRLLATHWTIVTAASVEEALAAIRAAPTALVLADVARLDREELALVRVLRGDPALATVPVILLSGAADVEGRVGGLEAGADDVLPLPFTERELHARIRGHLHLARLRREAQTLREDFIAAAAHDLSTPLTSIQIGLGLLEVETTGLTPDARGVLETVRRNAQRLAIHVGDLVAANQLRADLLPLRSEPIDLRDVVREAALAVQLLFHEKEQRVEIALPRPLPVWGDARRLEQVLVNLLANAHRYTPHGSLVSIGERAASAGIQLIVSDNGPGIPADEQERIFERHHRLAPGYGGSGLGLTIARSLVELHGGRIWVENAPGHGAQFHISLPHGREGGRSDEESEEFWEGEPCAS